MMSGAQHLVHPQTVEESLVLQGQRMLLYFPYLLTKETTTPEWPPCLHLGRPRVY